MRMQNGEGVMKRTRAILPAALFVLAVAGVAKVHVSTDYSHSTNFAQYHTYSWLKVEAGDSLWDQRVRHDVDAQLAARGWHAAPSGGQASVAAFATTEERPTVQTFYSDFGPGFGGWFWGGGWTDGYATTEVYYTPIGSLVVDIFDSHSQHLLWRAISTQALSHKPVKNERKLAKAVDKMFRTFPPQGRG
jgi:hypothetical protein